MSNEFITGFVTFVVVAVIIAIAAGLVFLVDLGEKSHDDKLWNNGHCECGGTWE